MAAKPTPGGSDGTYGTELNEFLDVSLDDSGKIKVFDSDWFAIEKGESVTKTHNLGSRILDVTVLQAASTGASPDPNLLFKALWANVSGVGNKGPSVRIASTTLIITAGDAGAIYYLDDTDGTSVTLDDGFYRVIARRMD